MAQVPDYILEKVKKYLARLEENKIHIEQAILFGSYAKGNFNEWSDIDLALVSNSFQGLRYNDIEKIRKYKYDIDYSISPIPYTVKDFNDEDLFIKNIKETGIKLI
jgi:uncharacterized protein